MPSHRHIIKNKEMKKTFEVRFRKKDGTIQRTEWFHKPFYISMRKCIDEQIKRGEEIDMVVHSITRIN